jgi:hypothetical protein
MHAAHKIVDHLLENEDEADAYAQLFQMMGGKPRRVKTKNYSAIKYPNGREIRTYQDGHTEFMLNGQLHREDGPACEWPGITKIWFLNGQRHREDGPAVENADGKLWYRHDELHRDDGPAIEWANGAKEWCLDGWRMTEEAHAERTQNR